jgi:hypothetical protein
MKTIQDHLDTVRAAFRALSPSRRKTLVREARAFIRQSPASADSNGFWRGLSARQVIAENCK